VALGVGRWVNPLLAEVEQQGASEDAGAEDGGHSKGSGHSSESSA